MSQNGIAGIFQDLYGDNKKSQQTLGLVGWFILCIEIFSAKLYMKKYPTLNIVELRITTLYYT